MPTSGADVLTDLQAAVLSRLDDNRFQAPRAMGLVVRRSHGANPTETLRELAQRGLVERRKHHGSDCRYWGTASAARCGCKGKCTYRRTPAGRSAVAASR